jgi:hypothetical protein
LALASCSPALARAVMMRAVAGGVLALSRRLRLSSSRAVAVVAVAGDGDAVEI